MFPLVIMMVGGLLLPVQTCFNSRLREAVGSPFVSSLWSFMGGTLFLLAVASLVEGRFLFPAGAVAGEPAWIWVGGLLGVIGLTTNIFVFPKIGGVQAVILPIAGQIVMGLVIDAWGLFSAPQQAMTPLRLVGAVLVAAGVLGAVTLGSFRWGRPRIHAGRCLSSMGSGQGTGRHSAGESVLGWQLLALFTGFLMASQSAINGYLGQLVGSGIKAALVSFSVGTLVLVVLVAALRIPLRLRVPAGKTSNPLWMWGGGPLGATYVTLNALFVPVLGTGVTIVASLVGMVTASLIVDRFGIFQAQRRPVSVWQVASLLVMLGGVALIRLV